MSIRIYGATSGYVDLDAPAVAGSASVTLPTLGFGKVLQVVTASYGTTATNSTSTYADTGLTATITPSSTSSKVLVIVFQNGCAKTNGNAQNGVTLKLVRGSTDLSVFAQYVGWTGALTYTSGTSAGVVYLDSPNTTSATTYKTQFMNGANAAQVSVQSDSSVSTIALIEIGP